MPRIQSGENSSELNKALDRIDRAEKKIITLQDQLKLHGHQLSQLDFAHGPQTTNNMVFTWTGDTLGAGKITWAAGWLKDKNASATKLTPPFSSAPGAIHIIPILANATGITGLTPNTYYWMCWSKLQQQMFATIDASFGYQNFNTFVICQVFTGTTAQTGVAGGGGSLVAGGSEFSGAKYKNF